MRDGTNGNNRNYDEFTLAHYSHNSHFSHSGFSVSPTDSLADESSSPAAPALIHRLKSLSDLPRMSEKFEVRVKITMILRSLLVYKGRKSRGIWAEPRILQPCGVSPTDSKADATLIPIPALTPCH